MPVETTSSSAATTTPAPDAASLVGILTRTTRLEPNATETTSALAPDGLTAVLIEPGTFGDLVGGAVLEVFQGTLASEPSQPSITVMSKVLRINVPTANISRPIYLRMMSSSGIGARGRRRLLLTSVTIKVQTSSLLKFHS